jgi:CMP-N,N'-diacetyllegionaminic acid synthase
MQIKNRVLGILPARGGSKGIPGKNLRPLLGKPLIAWAAEALANSKMVERAICCTDDNDIAKVAQLYGLEVPWLRPRNLALDESLVAEVVEHALTVFHKKHGISFTHIVLVQATSPTVFSEDIDLAINLALEKNADTVISGFHVGQYHPSAMYKCNIDGSIKWLLDESNRMARRQDLEPIFLRTGLVYVIKANLILEKKTIYGERIFSIQIPKERSITIDEENDFKIAEILLSGG